MNPHLKLLAAAVAAIVLAAMAFAAEVSPNGTWKWKVQARPGGQGFEQTLRLELKDGKLTGVLLGIKGGQFQVPDTPISEASFSGDGTVKFAVTRELNGRTFTTRYEGKLAGDSITGSYESPGLAGKEPAKREWDAHRVK